MIWQQLRNGVASFISQVDIRSIKIAFHVSLCPLSSIPCRISWDGDVERFGLIADIFLGLHAPINHDVVPKLGPCKGPWQRCRASWEKNPESASSHT